MNAFPSSPQLQAASTELQVMDDCHVVSSWLKEWSKTHVPWPLGIGIGIKLVGLLLGGAVEMGILMSFHV